MYLLKCGLYHQVYDTMEQVLEALRPGKDSRWPEEVLTHMILTRDGSVTNVALTSSGPVSYTLQYIEEWTEDEWFNYLDEGYDIATTEEIQDWAKEEVQNQIERRQFAIQHGIIKEF